MSGETTKTCECGHDWPAHGDRAIAACMVKVEPSPVGFYRLRVACPCLGWEPTTLE
jgi:hypothetical protein